MKITKTETYPVYVRQRSYDTRVMNGVVSSLYATVDKEVKLGDYLRIRVSDPDYQVLIAKRLDATNPYTRREFRGKPYKAYGRFHHAALAYSGKGFSSNLTAPTQAQIESEFNRFITEVADIALAKLKGRLANQVGAIQALVPIAETRELRSLVKSMASGAYEFLIGLSRLRRGNTETLRKLISDKWLTYSFGLAPMVGEAAEIAEGIAAWLERHSRTIRLTGKHEKVWRSSSKTTGSFCQGGQLEHTISDEYLLGVRYIAGIDLDLLHEDYTSLQHFGMTKESILPLMWELGPFSWIADYFTTAGAFLEDVYQTPPGDTTYVVKNTRFTFIRSHSAAPKPTSGYIMDNSLVLPGELRYMKFSREPLSQLPHRSFRFKNTDEIGLNAVAKLLNLSALLGRSSNATTWFYGDKHRIHL